LNNYAKPIQLQNFFQLLPLVLFTKYIYANIYLNITVITEKVV